MELHRLAMTRASERSTAVADGTLSCVDKAASLYRDKCAESCCRALQLRYTTVPATSRTAANGDVLEPIVLTPACHFAALADSRSHRDRADGESSGQGDVVSALVRRHSWHGPEQEAPAHIRVAAANLVRHQQNQPLSIVVWRLSLHCSNGNMRPALKERELQASCQTACFSAACLLGPPVPSDAILSQTNLHAGNVHSAATGHHFGG